MGTSLTEFRDEVLDRLLEFLWSQWSALGVSGYSAAPERRVIDPEPLLLLSLTVCRYDARLFDEILDWLQVNGAFLNVQRLKGIEKQADFQAKAQLAAVSELLSKKSMYALKWKGLASSHASSEDKPLFFAKDGTPLPVPPLHAAEFSAHGLLRGPLRLRGYSKPFPALGTATLLLRLRALIGVNSRCELFCMLGATDEIHPSDIARQTGYFPRTTQLALAEMSRSGVVEVRASHREKLYRLKPGVLDYLLRPEGIRTPWQNWTPLFRALEILWLELNEPTLQDLDPLLLSSELRRLVRKLRPLLSEANRDKRLRDDRVYPGESYTEIFFQDVREIIEQIATAAPPEGSGNEALQIHLLKGRQRFEAVLTERKAKLPPHGIWEVALAIRGRLPEYHANSDFLNLLRSNNPDYTGWPVWLISRDFRNQEDRPYFFEGGWESLILALEMGHLDFMRLEPNGNFYLLRGLEDDLSQSRETPLSILDFGLPIIRVAEALGVGISFAKAMGCEDANLSFAFRWAGLKGRQLGNRAMRGRYISPGRTAYQDEVTSYVHFSADTPLSELGGLVKQAVAPLLHVFDGFELNIGVYNELTSQLLERRL